MGIVDCCSPEKMFLYVNYIFAMYAGSLLITAARLTLDPSTYAWFRFLFDVQYRVTVAYLYSLGILVGVLVLLSASAVYPRAKRRLQAYLAGTALAISSEIVYSVWMYNSLCDWWTSSQRAELLRSGLALQDDVKALLVILQKNHQVVEEVNNAVHEVEQDAPKNVYVICGLLAASVVLQVAASVLSWTMQRRTEHRASIEWGHTNRVMYSAVAPKTRNKDLDLREAT